MFRILGVDPGTGIVGFGCIDVKGSALELVSAGVIRTSAGQPDEQRLLIIYKEINQIIKEYSPNWISIEKLFFARNVTTAMTVSQSRGVILLAASQANLSVAEYTPLQIKMAITGYGRAEKKQMQEMVRLLLKLDKVPKPDDAADALAAAITHAQFAH
ncbi:crossover junction endodeoxyribonuclease RuvC [Patescibacteria group bacterium]|jgi:crossover junction endodeoxyribonuclease RuvC|nr:crossover junction endodeoxyribonuclease RuvC [Patescibacteria group bacterium]